MSLSINRFSSVQKEVIEKGAKALDWESKALSGVQFYLTNYVSLENSPNFYKPQLLPPQKNKDRLGDFCGLFQFHIFTAKYWVGLSIPLTGFSRQEYQSDLPFPPPSGSG